MITLTATISGQRVHLRAVSDTPAPVITVTRSTTGGPPITVRGADQVPSSAVVVDDYEITYQAPLTYTADDGQESTTVTVTVEESRAWLRSVLYPELSIPVWIASHAEATRTARTTLLRPMGRRNPVAITDVRGGLAGDSVLYTWDDTGRDGMIRLLSDGGVLLLTGPASWRLGPLYCVFGDVAEGRPGNLAETSIRRWACNWVEVDPPPGDVPAAKRTLQDVKDLGDLAVVARYRFIDLLYADGMPR